MKRNVLAVAGVLAGALMLVGCGGNRPDAALLRKDIEIRDLRAQKEDRERLLAQQQAEKDKLMAANRKWQEENAAIAKRNADEMAALNDKVAELNKKMNAQDITINNNSNVNNGGPFTVTLAGSMLFDSGSAELKKAARGMLKELAGTIKTKYPDKFLRVEGHTDADPIRHSKWKDNMALSAARAQTVHDYLVKECGMAVDKMYVAGFGSKQPLVTPEKTKADKAKNRRVDLVILPNVPVEKRSLSSNK
jgi:chemotaxis protein MotB